MTRRHVVAGLAAALGTALGGGALRARRWDRETARAVDALLSDAAPAVPVAPAQPAALPAPVARYFAFALPDGAPRVVSARIEHAGEFRMAPDRPWLPFRSVQHIRADRPGFVWDARIRMLPLAAVRVRDAYLRGRGSTRASLGGVLTVADQGGTREIASSALHRYLAELAWTPTALLPRAGLSWAPLGDASARVTLRDGPTAVSLDVHLAESGGIARVEGTRYRDVDGVGVPTPFVGRHDRYRRAGGMMIPTSGEAAWLLPEGEFAFWRGRISAADFRLT